MRALLAPLLVNKEILPGVHLLEVQASQLARGAQPGQYCMLRGCDGLASDPLLRRPFFVAGVEPERSLCRFLVHKRGRASNWLTRLQAGMELDLLGPLGHGWSIRPQARNLLLIGEDPLLAALLFLAGHAIKRELAVTLIHLVESAEQGYPVALLPPELEYQLFPAAKRAKALTAQIGDYLTWADAVFCSVTEETLLDLTHSDAHWGERSHTQAIVARPLACITGTCLACRTETRQGPRLVCREGPVFAWRDLVF
jgi:dihydroorotate dehydrogenase electron transfer subunit